MLARLVNLNGRLIVSETVCWEACEFERWTDSV